METGGGWGWGCEALRLHSSTPNAPAEARKPSRAEPSRVSCTFAVLLSGPRVPGGVCGETGVRRRTGSAPFCYFSSRIRAVKVARLGTLRNSKGDFSGRKDQSALI